MSAELTLHADAETHSPLDLKKVGAYRYFECADTDAWCLSWAINDEPIELWKKGEPPPARLNQAIEDGARFVAHNSFFERMLFKLVLGPRYGFVVPKLEQCYCTAAAAAAMALPRDLAGVAYALGLDEQKDMNGRRVMLQLARPRIVNPNGTFLWWDSHVDGPAKLEVLYDYCVRDTSVERQVDKHVRPLSEFERRVWLLDQQINERGVPVDVAAVQHARWVLYHHAERLGERLRTLTGGHAQTANQVARIVEWLNRQGIDVEKLDKAAVKNALEEVEDIEETCARLYGEEEHKVTRPIREVLHIRQELSKSSVKKLEAFTERCSQDRRARDNLMFFGASTGRWGGRGIQLHNMPRKQTKKIPDPKTGRLKAVELFSNSEIEWAFSLLPQRDPVVIEQTLGSPTIVMADMLKGFIKAPAGKKIVKGDYSNIEGRVAAWLADEHWKIEAFKAADRKEGPDIYLLTGSKIAGCHVSELTKESPERQWGKVGELACIAENELVLTDVGLVPIQDVTRAMRVWDGVEFVLHDGVVFRGTKEVITHDGLTATRDHLVWTTACGRPSPFEEAAKDGAALLKSGAGRQALGVQSRARQAQELDGHSEAPRFARVYDVVNAGPRHRFTVSNALVHNCQFGGSVGALQTMAAVYDVQFTNAFAKEVVDAWRDAHPAICAFWYRLEDAILHVVRNGGKATIGKVAFAFHKGFLWARKPNGELLCYVDPRIRVTRRVLNDKTGTARSEIADKDGIFRGSPYVEDDPDCEWRIQVPEHEAVTVMSVNSQTRKWERVGLYGGLIFENFVQAIARDCMVNGMFNLEDAGYPIILTVHDEIISEVDSEFGSAKQFEALMVEPADWMAGLPIRAEADECIRYRK